MEAAGSLDIRLDFPYNEENRSIVPPRCSAVGSAPALGARAKGTQFHISGCSAVGSARGLGPRGRWFEPSHSDQISWENRHLGRFFCVSCDVFDALTQIDFEKMGQKKVHGGGEVPQPESSLTQIPTQTGKVAARGGECRALLNERFAFPLGEDRRIPLFFFSSLNMARNGGVLGLRDTACCFTGKIG